MLDANVNLCSLKARIMVYQRFSFQKMNVPVDSCMLDRDSSLLQQGADITGGLYVKVPNLESLFQFLVWVFLPESASNTSSGLRKQLAMPSSAKVWQYNVRQTAI